MFHDLACQLAIVKPSCQEGPVKPALPAMMMPMITPNNPNALPKISTTRIFTNSVAFCASDSAALLPTMPTQTLHSHSTDQTSVELFSAAQKEVFAVEVQLKLVHVRVVKCGTVFNAYQCPTIFSAKSSWWNWVARSRRPTRTQDLTSQSSTLLQIWHKLI